MKMKVAVLSRHFSKTGGGAESYAVHLATSMLPECDITVVSQSFDESAAMFKHIAVPKLPIGSRWVNQLWFSWYSKRMTRHGFDVVHSHENITHGQVHTVHVKTVHASLKQKGMSAWRIALSPRLLCYLWIEKMRLCSVGHQSVFVSQLLLDETNQELPCVQSACVIAPGVEIPRLAVQKSGKGTRMTIGFVGHDFKKKGLATLLKAVALLPFEAQIMVVGNPAQAERYQDLVKALGVGKSCRFLGVVRDMPSVYAEMDCLAHPTTQDVFPMVLLEAMARYVPVVTTAAPFNSMASLLIDHRDAILLPFPDDVDGLALALRDVWSNVQLRDTLGVNGFAFAEKYSWDIAKARYYEIYRAVQQTL